MIVGIIIRRDFRCFTNNIWQFERKYTYLSIPIAVFVNILIPTLETWINRTTGHIAAPKIQWPSIVLVKLNGIQKQAMNKSAIDMFNRNLVSPVLDLFPKQRTIITNKFPIKARAVVAVYNIISDTCDSYGNSNSG